MNTSHYPSLELCKKLTEAWFWHTEKVHLTPFPENRPSWEIETIIIDSDKTHYFEWEVDIYVAPSVMELLDCTPIDKIDIWYSYPDWRLKLKENTTSDVRNETFPNALAEMWLWLKENNYLIK